MSLNKYRADLLKYYFPEKMANLSQCEALTHKRKDCFFSLFEVGDALYFLTTSIVACGSGNETSSRSFPQIGPLVLQVTKSFPNVKSPKSESKVEDFQSCFLSQNSIIFCTPMHLRSHILRCRWLVSSYLASKASLAFISSLS